MLLMDGDDQFGAARTAYQTLQAAGAIGPILLVGVGYGATYRRPANKRIRDYTPTPLPTESESGQVSAFLAFLTETLMPALAKRYPLRDDGRGIGGHSLGALVALQALVEPQPAFTHYFASAPSLWWDDRSPLRKLAERQARSVVLPGKLFLGVGSNDSESMLSDLSLLENQLAAQPFEQLSVTCRRYPGRDHYDVLPEAFREGLTVLFSSLLVGDRTSEAASPH
jgi:predicted alpha/beta superfamily hydrolase